MMYDTAVVDGNNIFFKCFVTQTLSVKIKGETITTGAIYGFIQSMLTIKRNLLKDESEIIVTWDRGHTRRSALYPDYKGNRDKSGMDYEDFKDQQKRLSEILPLIGIKQAYKDGEEADDIVGTISKLRADKGKRVIIISADKDFQQLIDNNIDLYAQKTKTNVKLWNEEEWTEAHGFHPKKFSYVLGLMGDSGDNIPGVAGIGEKGAFKLIIENCRLLEEILCDGIITDLIPPGKKPALIEKLINEEGQKMFKLSYELALIDRNVRGVRFRKAKKNMEELEDIFEMYKFNNLLKEANWKALEGI